MAGTEAGDPTDPHGRPPHGSGLSVVALGYYWLDFVLGGLLRVGPTRSRSGLVIIERGWWDVAVDPRRYRMRVPPALIRVLGHLLPRPDLMLVLRAPESVLASRKGEISDEEARRQNAAWRTVSQRVERAYIDASASIDEVVAQARDAIFERLSDRAVRRLGSGWAGMPPGAHRWVLPKGPRTAAAEGLAIYQPVTARGRVGWELARLGARAGAFRLSPLGGASSVGPRGGGPVRSAASDAGDDAREPSAPPRRRRDRRTRRDACDREGCCRRRGTLQPSCRGDLVDASRLVPIATGSRPTAHRAGRRRPRPRGRPVAAQEAPVGAPDPRRRACGELFRHTASSGGERGAAHGDLAPWNVLLMDDGWTLVDWENASDDAPPFTDVLHYLVQAHALLGRPSRRDLIASVATGRGSGGAAIRVYGLAAGVSAGVALDVFHEYLERRSPRSTRIPATAVGEFVHVSRCSGRSPRAPARSEWGSSARSLSLHQTLDLLEPRSGDRIPGQSTSRKRGACRADRRTVLRQQARDPTGDGVRGSIAHDRRALGGE